MKKGNSKVALFISLLLLGFMLLIGSCVSKIEPTKQQCHIDSIHTIDTSPSTLKGESKWVSKKIPKSRLATAMRDSLVSKNDTNKSLIKEGFATYYKEGTVCADGSKFNVNNLTVAFYTNQSKKREWLGKKLLLKYGAASVIVKVTDNGNFLPLGNSIDCTPAVFRALDIPLFKGKAKIEIYRVQD